jgi:predicted AAA+ superfamily ATPase
LQKSEFGMYQRQANDTLLRLARGFPVLALTGPRQSGKTTLARSAFSQKPYVSLENPDERDFAERDPFSAARSYCRGCRVSSMNGRSWGSSS